MPPNNMSKNVKATTKQVAEHISEIAEVMKAWLTRTVYVTKHGHVKLEEKQEERE
jgi:hypothetical protein